MLTLKIMSALFLRLVIARITLILVTIQASQVDSEMTLLATY